MHHNLTTPSAILVQAFTACLCSMFSTKISQYHIIPNKANQHTEREIATHCNETAGSMTRSQLLPPVLGLVGSTKPCTLPHTHQL